MLQAPTLGSLRNIVQQARLTGFKSFIRSHEIGLLMAAIAIGIASGVVVTAMGMASHFLHLFLFGVSDSERLDVIALAVRARFLIAPIVGGVVLGVLLFILAKTRKRPMVDPIAANALHGGHLSLTDSVIVAVQNIISNGFGASVGLEAGYTQLASGLASKLGGKMQLRRADLRILVGCGAAGAIAAAFDAPLAGAFYAFELIIATYSIVALTPVVVSALVATLIARLLLGNDASIDIGAIGSIAPADYVPAILLGICCAGAGIVIMQGVAFVEEIARKSFIPMPVRPALGAIAVGLLALISPQVLSAGHSALHVNLANQVPIGALALLFILKSLASAISIGSGFRGGLFSLPSSWVRSWARYLHILHLISTIRR